MSWFGDVGNFELFNLKGMANQVKDNPARLLYGAADPFSTKVWNKILGRDDKPLVDQWGGAASHRYDEAEDAGIDTGAGKQAHGIAKAIASFYAGGYGAGKAGGLLGGQGAGATAGSGSAGGTGYGLGQPVVSGSAGNATYAGGQSQGLLGGFGDTLSSFNETAKPYMDAYQMGSQLMPQQQGQQAAPAPVMAQNMGGGPEALAAIATQGRQAQDASLQNAATARNQRRLNRRGLL